MTAHKEPRTGHARYTSVGAVSEFLVLLLTSPVKPMLIPVVS
jgi:hypothetical protein